MSKADEMAIEKARAAAATSRAQADAVVEAEEAMLRSFATKAREVLAILERAGCDGAEMQLLRIPRLVRRRTFFRDAVYATDERAGWLLHRFSFIWGGENTERCCYWLVSDGTIALSGEVANAATSARPADLRFDFHERDWRQEVRAAHAALVALGDKYAAVAAAREQGGCG